MDARRLIGVHGKVSSADGTEMGRRETGKMEIDFDVEGREES